MLKERMILFIQKIQEIQKMSDWKERRAALDIFFTEGVDSLGLGEKEYVLQDVIASNGDRKRFFFYGEEEDCSDVIINTVVGGSEGQGDKISIASRSLSVNKIS